MSDEHEYGAYTDFAQVCYECDPPASVSYMNGQRVPSKCEHELPAVVVEINTERDP
jgi:hypothetical protein